jgi:uncharacterized cupin superfamily protein
MANEARLERSESGLKPVSDGWFVINVRDAEWMTNDALGAVCFFETDEAPFAEVGYTLVLLTPGQTGGRYHREANQEDFLVLSGECLLVVEGQERPLRAWDFVHCPPDTEHVFVATSDEPCLIFMTGARTNPGAIVYPRSEVALRHGAGVEEETTVPREAYAPLPKWQPGRPAGWDALPWS